MEVKAELNKCHGDLEKCKNDKILAEGEVTRLRQELANAERSWTHKLDQSQQAAAQAGSMVNELRQRLSMANSKVESEMANKNSLMNEKVVVV